MTPERSLIWRYLEAKRAVIDAGYADEVVWQATLSPVQVTARSFVEQAAWVVLSSGLAEQVVRPLFPALSATFHNFDLDLLTADSGCRGAALSAFRHPAKIDAILEIASFARAAGDDVIRRHVSSQDTTVLMGLPFIGPATVRHLLKNLGVAITKPDRHLLRLASAIGRDVDVFCNEIAEAIEEPLGVVDVVLWRWSVLHYRVCRSSCDGLPHALR